jgi:hypothetical protein
MRKLTVGLLSAAALATTILFVRQQKQVEMQTAQPIPAGESEPATISLERIRELGL